MSHILNLAISLSKVRFEHLSDERQQRLLRHLLDTVGASMAGSQTSEGGRILSFYGSDTIAGQVAARCAVTRLTEIDDIDIHSCTTPGSIVVPTALTLASHGHDVPFGALASAVCAGYAAMMHLGRMIDGAAILYRGVWPTLFCAPIAAAAVAAHLRNLDPERFSNALALAVSLSGGRSGHGQPGLSGRWLLAGEAARLGVMAARAAEAGFVGDPSILDGQWLERAQGIQPQDPGPLEDLSDGSFLTELSLKPYCSAKQLMAALQAFESLLAGGLRPDAIHSVDIAVPPRYAAMLDHGATEGDRLSGIASAPFTLALAAFQPEKLLDVGRANVTLPEAANAFMARVSVTPDETLDCHLPHAWPARVTVRTETDEFVKTVVEARGDPDDPLNDQAVAEKFARATGRPEDARTWADRIMSLSAGDRTQPLCARYGSIFGD